MIKKVIVAALLKPALDIVKEDIIYDIFAYIDNMYDSGDRQQLHILSCLADASSMVTIDDVNVQWLNEHKNLIMESDNYKLKDYKIVSVNNVGCYVEINYNYYDKTGNTYNSTTSISFLNYPEIINK